MKVSEALIKSIIESRRKSAKKIVPIKRELNGKSIALPKNLNSTGLELFSGHKIEIDDFRVNGKYLTI